MVLSCPTLPRAIIDASGAELDKDLTAVSATSASLSTGEGDNTNIYKLLLGPSGLSAPSVTVSGTNSAKTFNSTPTKDAILTAFDASSNVTDIEIETLLRTYGFTPLTSMSGTTTQALQTELTLFDNKVKFTYCCYKTLYRKALQEFFDAPISETAQKRAIILNLKLTIIIAGLYRIRSYFQDKSATIMANSNLNNDIEDTTQTLQEQLTTLTSKDSDKKLYARMVEYTEEKNQAHRNLLGMYTVLNLVALGLIFYIAKD